MNVTKNDIQCYNFNNGQLSVNVTGGNGGYQYYWERQNSSNGSWSSYFQLGANINNVGAGWYRSKIVDAKNCSGFSLPIQIIEPDSLRIDSVRVNDIPCFSGSGFATIYARGGTAPYTQEYLKLPAGNYIPFTPTTGLAAGRYLFRVVDSKGCITYARDTATITSPPSNLDFTYTQAEVNGFNISCYGADNGTITITANGGNGDNYAGYFYTYDAMPWQTNNVLTNIPAGSRVIKVSDARGCIISKTVLFTQPNDSLTTSLLSKTDIVCNGAATGLFSIRANGGVRPYRYSINAGTTYQADSTFTSLVAGNYIVTIKDNNNCTGFINVSLINTNPVINSIPNITNIACNGGTNGAITTMVSGGVAPYTYSWVGASSNTSNVANLASGTYIQRVTDAVGCIKDFTFNVTQPAVLAPIVTPYPVCYGSSTGKIVIRPVGGTAPFTYSKDNGTTYQTDSIFNNLPQNVYSIKVKDAKNCEWVGTTTVGVISNNPNLNFIISSNQHAQDTITMKEISWVKPDSIKWEFHPAATIIDNNRLEPKIKFNNFDSANGYWVRLIGYYPTCTYTTQKTIKIYPYDVNAVVTTANFNRGIKKAELFPNPNNGQFTLNVEFYKLQKATLFITSIQGHVVGQKIMVNPTMQILRNFTTEMNGAGPGTYIMRIVSDYDSRYILFVKQ